MNQPAYWPTRILLVVGVIATLITGALALVMAVAEPPMFGPEPTYFGLQNRGVISVADVAVAIVGLAWMVRIFRGPRAETAAWRYRDS